MTVAADRRTFLAGVVAISVASCADDAPVADNAPLPPLSYEYLTPIRLNVAAVEVVDQSEPSPDAATDPAPPADALRRMAADRIQALGQAGRAVMVIRQASIVRPRRGTFEGTLAVRLDVIAPDRPEPAAYAEATVTRSVTAGGGGDRRTLYDLTKQMMDAMNVEFEFQVKRALRDWIVAEPAPSPQPIEQAPLPPTDS